VCSTTGGIVGRLVVDVDSADPHDHAEAIARFGDSPVKVTTPSGGLHLWFASPGGVPNAQRVDGMPVDIRGDGGIAVLPPSVRQGKGTYAFLEGDWAALLRLPLPRPGSLPSPATKAPRKPPGASLASPDTVQRGQRNQALFDRLRAFAASCDDEAEIAAEALRWNAELPQPLPVNEALKVAGSVSRYKAAGSLMVPGGRAMVAIRATAIRELGPDELFLLMLLQSEHQGTRDQFIIAAKAMAASLAWGERRLRNARQQLLDRGFLVQVRQGGDHKGDAATFAFGPALRAA
jgi:hypothetical protein